MKEFAIFVTWRVGVDVYVKAETEKEALELAWKMSTRECVESGGDAWYVDDSFHVDEDSIEEMEDFVEEL